MKIECLHRVDGKIIKVLKQDGTPIHRSLWMTDMYYIKERIHEGCPAVFYKPNGAGFLTVVVDKVDEDENNLVITADNITYHIKKIKE
jgi:hypothetical protein